MHELAVTESLLEITLRHAQNANARRVDNLYLVIGQLSSIIDDSVQFYWDIVAKDTIAEGARLNFRRIPTQIECRNCQHVFIPDDTQFECPDCGSDRVKIICGEEFYLEAIDIQ
jgi:hydrogenase nickel incorporation protein HypA/HybF